MAEEEELGDDSVAQAEEEVPPLGVGEVVPLGEEGAVPREEVGVAFLGVEEVVSLVAEEGREGVPEVQDLLAGDHQIEAGVEEGVDSL